MTDSGAERAARLAELLLDIAYDSLFTHAQKMRHIQAVIIREETGTQWISVGERLPDQEGKFLVLRINEYPKMDIEWYMKRGPWDSGFYDDGEQDTNVSHWMPLPAAPDEGGKR